MALDADTPAGATTRAALAALDAKCASHPKKRAPHRDLGDWWALYDYGEVVVKGWSVDYVPPYPEAAKRAADRAARAARRAAKKAAAAAAGGVGALSLTADASSSSGAVVVAAPPSTTIPLSIALAPGGATPNSQTAFLFPGQGAQAVGMLTGATAALLTVRAMLDEAASVLGYDLGAVCAGGPKSRLDDTAVAQPALFVAGLAAVELLASTDGAATATSASAVAGLSLGEYAALVHAGALSFADGLRLVAARGVAMAAAAAAGPPHGMLSIVGLDDVTVDAAVAAGRATGGTCAVANRLFPTGRVLSGHATALDAAAASATAAGALKVIRLSVAGGFHTPLMAPAADALRAALAARVVHTAARPCLLQRHGRPLPRCRLHACAAGAPTHRTRAVAGDATSVGGGGQDQAGRVRPRGADQGHGQARGRGGVGRHAARECLMEGSVCVCVCVWCVCVCGVCVCVVCVCVWCVCVCGGGG